MNIKKILVGAAAGALMLGAFASSAFATQNFDLTNNQWRILDRVYLPNGNTNFMTRHPSDVSGVVSFPFLNPTDGYTSYLLGNYNNDLTSETITANASWTSSTTYVTRSGSGAYGRLEFQDTSSGTYNSNDYWWYIGQTYDLNNSTTQGNLTASFADSNRANWLNQSGKLATDMTTNWQEWQGDIVATSPYDGFTNAMKNVKQMGLSFGGPPGSYASGVANVQPASFQLNSFTVAP